MTLPEADLLTCGDVALEWRSIGRGDPCTVVAHGLGGSIDTTRPFASGLTGRRVFFHFRGHGASSVPPGRWSYDDLARDLECVADRAGARRAIGVSMGAGAICALLAREPDRFDRVVLALPAVLDRPRGAEQADALAALADALEGDDAEATGAALLAQQAPEVRLDPQAAAWAQEQAAWLRGCAPGVARAARELPGLPAVADRSALAQVRARVLVIAAEGDPVHPVEVAREVAASLLDARLAILPPGGLLWAHRARLRSLVGDFLGG